MSNAKPTLAGESVCVHRPRIRAILFALGGFAMMTMLLCFYGHQLKDEWGPVFWSLILLILATGWFVLLSIQPTAMIRIEDDCLILRHLGMPWKEAIIPIAAIKVVSTNYAGWNGGRFDLILQLAEDGLDQSSTWRPIDASRIQYDCAGFSESPPTIVGWLQTMLGNRV